MSQPFDDSIAIGKHSISRIFRHPSGWTDGVVHTPLGTVQVYAQGDENEWHHTRLDFVWQGRLYMRNIPGKRLSPRGLVTAAHRFAGDVIYG